ncbi:MAG: DUF452 family protein [Bacteroidales bacterium]|nr:DUF452 family protein [Bacteroidales bacterium]
MQTVFLKNNNAENLIVFFCGWGMDIEPFKNKFDSLKNSDICLCFDYQDVFLNTDVFKKYNNKTIIAWSLGVYIASLFADTINPERMIAINGTLFPIDDEKGIAKNIFFSTLDNISEENIARFQRRMCGSKSSFKDYIDIKPKRSIESLKSELKFISELYENYSSAFITKRKWDLAVIGSKDLIFTPENQKKGWSENSQKTIIVDESHYFPAIPLLDLNLYE